MWGNGPSELGAAPLHLSSRDEPGSNDAGAQWRTGRISGLAETSKWGGMWNQGRCIGVVLVRDGSMGLASASFNSHRCCCACVGERMHAKGSADWAGVHQVYLVKT